VNQAARAVEAAQIKLDRLLDARLEGQVDAATYSRREAALVAERDAAQDGLAEARAALAAIVETEARSADAVRGAEAAHARLLDGPPLTFAEKQRILRTYIRQVVVYADRVEIQGILPTTPDQLNGYCTDDLAAL
jgi:hypothetical protein